MSRERLLKFLVAPAVIFSFFAGVLPMLFALRNSFYNINVRMPHLPVNFIGLENFSTILRDGRFQVALRNSFTFSFFGTMGALGLGFLFALILYFYFRDKKIILTILSTLLILPALTGQITVAYMWDLLYHPVLGLFSHISRSLGFGTIEFLSSRRLAMPSVIVTHVWQWSGFIALFLYAGLASLPEDFFEEAKVMGATFTQTLRYIVLPNLKGLFLAGMLLKFMLSLRSFELIRVMTGGGPGIATETADMYLYWLAVEGRGLLSRASAGAIIMLVFTIAIFLVIVNFYQKQRTEGT